MGDADVARHIADVSRWTLGALNGTHIDAPSHFLPNAPGLDSVPLQPLARRTLVVELPDSVTTICSEDLPWPEDETAGRLLLKTSNSSRRLKRAVFDEACVGIEPGPYRLTILPLRLVGAEAAPARAILEETST